MYGRYGSKTETEINFKTMRIKTLFLALLFSMAAPSLSWAATIYSYTPGSDPVNLGGYELSGIETAAEKAFDAVVAIDGYKDVPVYALERRVDAAGNVTTARRNLGTVSKRVSTGSGFFITSDGYILTNRHVVDDAAVEYIIDTGAGTTAARVVYKDPDYDLAVLKVDGASYPSIEISRSSDIEIGDEVVSVGNALGKFVDSVSSGRVISLDETVIARDGSEMEEFHGLIASNARLFPGDSGGPLLNSSGEAIGVNVAIIAGTNVSFSIPADITRSVIQRAGIDV
jgi:S1-C subfamily serine protease